MLLIWDKVNIAMNAYNLDDMTFTSWGAGDVSMLLLENLSVSQGDANLPLWLNARATLMTQNE